MTYQELPVGAEITLREKDNDNDVKKPKYRLKKYKIAAKYPRMCMAVNEKGGKKFVPIGEMIENGIITQEPYFEALRRESKKDTDSKGWHKKRTELTEDDTEYAL